MNFRLNIDASKYIFCIGILIMSLLFIFSAPPVKSIYVRYEIIPNYTPSLVEKDRINRKQEEGKTVNENWPEINENIVYRNGGWYKVVIGEKMVSIENISYVVFFLLSFLCLFLFFSGKARKFFVLLGLSKNKAKE